MIASTNFQVDNIPDESFNCQGLSHPEGQSAVTDGTLPQTPMDSSTYHQYDSGGFLHSTSFDEAFQLPGGDLSTVPFPGLFNSPSHNVMMNNPDYFLPQVLTMEDLRQGKDPTAAIQEDRSRTSSRELQSLASNDNSQNNSPGQGSLPRRRSWYSRSGGRKITAPRYIAINNENRSQTPPISQDPLQRWRDSPPEDEPASFLAIQDALQNMPSRPGSAEEKVHRGLFRRGTSINSADSIGSGSSTSASSMMSNTSSHGIPALSSRSTGRVSKPRKPTTREKDARPFCCTFCCDCFKTKYDWARHEKSLHLSMETWVCAPNGGTHICPETNTISCVYCDFPNPSLEHLEAHNHDICQRNDHESRVFRRKDNLVQHLRHVHLLDSVPHVEDWKTSMPVVKSRCGFCDLAMSSWKERQDHLATHFRKGQTMEHWRGDHGFEPSVLSLVTKSLSPYLIGTESKSLVPFSATSQGTKDHFSQIQSSADSHNKTKESVEEPQVPAGGPPLPELPQPMSSFAQVLTHHLGRYAQQQMKLGIIPTDEMFQQESRRICFNDEDPWNQTIADNAEWLGAFKSNYYDASNAGPRDASEA